MIYHHNLNPIAFSIFSMDLPWYWLNYLFGYLFVYLLGMYIVSTKYSNLTPIKFKYYAIMSWVGIIIGARIGYVTIYNLDYFIQYPEQILQIWQGGMSFHGALIGCGFCIYLVAKKYHDNFFAMTDIVAMLIGIPVFFGRIANFINGELIGIKTNGDWGVIYQHLLDQAPRHPSQLYQAFFEGLVIFVVLISNHQKLNYPGKLTGMFLILYGSIRFICEFFRTPDPQLGYLFGSFVSVGQILCIAMVIAGTDIYLTTKKLDSLH